MEVQSTVEQLSELIQTRNVLLVRRAPLSCISYVNGEIHSKAMQLKTKALDIALQNLVELAGSGR